VVEDLRALVFDVRTHIIDGEWRIGYCSWCDCSLLTFSDGLQPAGDTKRLTFENRGATSPAWAADGHEIVFYAPGGLWRIARPWAHGKDRQAATTSLFRRKRRQARHFQPRTVPRLYASFFQ